MKSYIYALLDPIDEKTCYIGKTTKPKQRYHAHLYSPKESRPKSAWIRSLLERGLKPLFYILEVTNKNLADAKERFWVQEMKKLGFSLLNQVLTKLQPLNEETLLNKSLEELLHDHAKRVVLLKIDVETTNLKNLRKRLKKIDNAVAILKSCIRDLQAKESQLKLLFYREKNHIKPKPKKPKPVFRIKPKLSLCLGLSQNAGILLTLLTKTVRTRMKTHLAHTGLHEVKRTCHKE